MAIRIWQNCRNLLIIRISGARFKTLHIYDRFTKMKVMKKSSSMFRGTIVRIHTCSMTLESDPFNFYGNTTTYKYKTNRYVDMFYQFRWSTIPWLKKTVDGSTLFKESWSKITSNTSMIWTNSKPCCSWRRWRRSRWSGARGQRHSAKRLTSVTAGISRSGSAWRIKVKPD